jgi:hypothetical protein
MRKRINLLVLSIFAPCAASRQNAVLHITLANGKSIANFLYTTSQPKSGSYSAILKDNRTSTLKIRG